MKADGIIRRVDNLGRIVIPIEIRRALSIEIKDLLEISLRGDEIILQRVKTSCALCGSDASTQRLGDKYICANCIRRIKQDF